jgi:hypothetical protein
MMSNLSDNDFIINSSIYLSDPTISENNLFIFILSVLLCIVLCVGLVGNILVIYVVLNYGRLKTVTNTYLLHLALSDLVFLTGVPFFISSIITRSWIFGSFVCKVFFLTQGVNQYTSIIILALLSFDRFLAVCYSAKSITWRSRVNPNVLLMLTWILSFLLMLPIIMFTTLQETVPSDVQCTIILPLPLSQSRMFYFIFVAYTSTIAFFLPFMLMIYFHIKIVHRLQYKIPKQHRRSRSSMRTRRKVTILVLSVISVHFLCCSPYWTFQMFTTSELLPQTSRILIPTSSLTQFLLFVNSSTNPILYAFISEIFRSSFKRAFYCCSTINDNSYIQERTVINRGNVLSIENGNNYSQTKSILTTRFENNHFQRNFINNNERSSDTMKQTNLILWDRQHRLSSLAPSASIFNSETSFVSDI